MFPFSAQETAFLNQIIHSADLKNIITKKICYIFQQSIGG